MSEDSKWKEEADSVVEIDEDQLNKECVKLPSQSLRYARQAAELRYDVDEAKANLEVIEAELSRKIRETPAVFGIQGRPTEGSVREAVVIQRRYKEAILALNDAKHELDVANAIVSALEHKKRSLTLLVELAGMSYFSDPKISKKGKEAVEQMTHEQIRKAARRRIHE